MRRIHILGASGSGTTTLGAALVERLDVPQVDTDAVFWLPTDPPFTERRPVAERLAVLRESLPRLGGWVLSGSALGWAAPIEPLYELIVYLALDPAIRMRRLLQRERTHYGRRIERWMRERDVDKKKGSDRSEPCKVKGRLGAEMAFVIG